MAMAAVILGGAIFYNKMILNNPKHNMMARSN